jgi:hypothetical protein
MTSRGQNCWKKRRLRQSLTGISWYRSTLTSSGEAPSMGTGTRPGCGRYF